MPFTFNLTQVFAFILVLSSTVVQAQIGGMHELTPEIRVWLPVEPEFEETDQVKYFTASKEDHFEIMIGLEMEDDAFSEIDTIETRYDRVKFYENWCLEELGKVEPQDLIYSEPWYISRYQGYQYAFRLTTDAGDDEIWATRIVLYKGDPLVFYAAVGDNQAGTLTLDKFFDSIQLDWDGSEVEWKEIHKGSHTIAAKLAEDRKAWDEEEAALEDLNDGSTDDTDDAEEEVVIKDPFEAYKSAREKQKQLSDKIQSSTLIFISVVAFLGIVALIIILAVRRKRIRARQNYTNAGASQPGSQVPSGAPQSPMPPPPASPSNQPEYPPRDPSDDDRWRPQ